MTQAMPLLKEMGTKLGLSTSKKGDMRRITDYVNQYRGQLLEKGEIIKTLNLQTKEENAIDNCYHRGYILRGQYKGNDYYFVPDESEPELNTLREEFEKLDSYPHQKLQLIEKLISNVSNKYQNNGAYQTPTSQGHSSQESGTNMIAVQKEIDKLEKEIKTLDEALKVMKSHDPQVIDLRQHIEKTEIEILSKQYLLAVFREELGNIP